MVYHKPVSYSAVLVGAGIFIALYLLLALGLVFALSLLQQFIVAGWIEGAFRLLGLLALVFPAYAAARIAGSRGVLHGLLTGLAAAAISALFLLLTFSWEGSYRAGVWFAILKVSVLALALGALGGALADWRRRQGK